MTSSPSIISTPSPNPLPSSHPNRGEGWKERYIGGSPAAEAQHFEAFSHQIHQVQARNHKSGEPMHRALHAKMQVGVTDAQFTIDPNLPDFLQQSIFQPGAVYQAAVRLSNASGKVESDQNKDLRGLAVRVCSTDATGQSQFNDLLMTNAPASHARNAEQFMATALAASAKPAFLIPVRLIKALGLSEALRIISTLRRDRKRIESMATETYWSRGPFQLGQAALQFQAKPGKDTPSGSMGSNGQGPDYLRTDLQTRLQQGPVVFDLYAQLFVDEQNTPIEDGSKRWEENISPPIPFAQLVIPQQDLTTSTAIDAQEIVQTMSFNPWNSAGETNFRPLSDLNRARKPVYMASAAFREENKSEAKQRRCPFAKLYSWLVVLVVGLVAGIVRLSEALLGASNQFIDWVGWAKIDPWLGVLNQIHLRRVLREKNLHDTETPASREFYDQHFPRGGGCPVMHLVNRSADGSDNDLSHPHMGRAGTRFGRNIPLDQVVRASDERLLTPNPRTIARALMTRTTFKPVPQLNLLAAAWIQFMVHDWVFHEVDPTQGIAIPIEEGDDWPADQSPMQVLRTAVDPRAAADPANHPTSYLNRETHWWDGSQLYGRDQAAQDLVRSQTDGKLRVDERGLLALRSPGAVDSNDKVNALEMTGVFENWWLGLGLLHSAFTLEHNAICDHLKQAYPRWSDEQLFQKARLVNTALLAKIHTVEWTPAILDHPTLEIGLNANWWGIAGEKIHKLLGRISEDEVLSGIPGSAKDHFGVPYAMTEEFTSVYRLHPLLPDELVFHSVRDGKGLKVQESTEGSNTASASLALGEVVGPQARDLMEQHDLSDLFYSFGLMHPGAITLFNYPNFLRDNLKHNEATIDLAAVEIFRDRERGVPRYNEFLRLIHKKPVKSFEELTGGDRDVAQKIAAVYNNNLEDVDLLVGLLAEQPLPEGFGFSDTAFRIFILMASRRLNSDRFFTTDYTPEVYTPEGMKWINDNTMITMLLRHFPQLEPALHKVRNGFAPWNRVGEG